MGVIPGVRPDKNEIISETKAASQMSTYSNMYYILPGISTMDVFIYVEKKVVLGLDHSI
jgi:hypothetical protein